MMKIRLIRLGGLNTSVLAVLRFAFGAEMKMKMKNRFFFLRLCVSLLLLSSTCSNPPAHPPLLAALLFARLRLLFLSCNLCYANGEAHCSFPRELRDVACSDARKLAAASVIAG